MEMVQGGKTVEGDRQERKGNKSILGQPVDMETTQVFPDSIHTFLTKAPSALIAMATTDLYLQL